MWKTSVSSDLRGEGGEFLIFSGVGTNILAIDCTLAPKASKMPLYARIGEDYKNFQKIPFGPQCVFSSDL